MSKNHIHKLRRKQFKTTGTPVYYCIDNCDYKVGVEFSLGKVTRCNSCNEPFAMNEYSIRAAKPKCMNCVKRRTLLGVKDANIVERLPTIEQIIPNKDSTSSLKERLSKTTTVIKEYNPEDNDDEL